MNGIAGFENLRWKMKSEEIKGFYPAFQATSNKNGVRHLEMTNYGMAGCRYTVSLGFFNETEDELATIQFAYIGEKADVCATQVKADLQREFGVGKVDLPEVHYSYEIPVRYTNWYGPQLEVQVDESTWPNNVKALSINYTHTGAPGTYIE